MQNLQNVKTADLILKIKSLVVEERRLGVEILWHLKEVDARRIHLEMGYPSLHEFAVRELGYSDGAAHRRIASMRAFRELPQVEEKLNSGALSLTTLSATQDFFYSEKKERMKIYTKEEKAEILEQIEHKSKRECLEVFASISPASVIPKETERPLSPDATEVRLVFDNETLALLKRIKDLTTKQGSEAIKYALQRTLDQIDPLRKAKRLEEKKAASPEKLAQLKTPSPEKLPSRIENAQIASDSRYVVAALRRLVWNKGNGRCQYISPTGKRCGSTFRLEVDHIHPFALGGKTESSNLRLLCAQHNLHGARVTFGAEKIARAIAGVSSSRAENLSFSLNALHAIPTGSP